MNPLTTRQFVAFWGGLFVAGDGLFLWIVWQGQPNNLTLVAGSVLLGIGASAINYSTALEGEPTP